jgi:hypothetical protein
MNYVLATFVVGAVIGGGALITSHPVPTNVDQDFSLNAYESPTQTGPIVDNEALSAEALSF